MNVKLTLTVDKYVIEEAKKYAKSSGPKSFQHYRRIFKITN